MMTIQNNMKDASDIPEEKRLEIGPHISDGNINSSGLMDSSAIQLFLRKKTMDSLLPSLTTFSRTGAQQQVAVPRTSGQEVNRFTWLLYRPQAHAVRPFESDHSSRQDKIVHTDPNKLR
jgi:hypothetical protein